MRKLLIYPLLIALGVAGWYVYEHPDWEKLGTAPRSPQARRRGLAGVRFAFQPAAGLAAKYDPRGVLQSQRPGRGPAGQRPESAKSSPR